MNAGTSTSLVYEGILSLRISAVPALPSVQLLTTLNEANEVLLQNVLMQDEKHEHDDNDEVMIELKRQDTKLRLIMELLGMLLLQQQLLPAPVRVRFSGEELAMPAADAPVLAVGSWVRCDLYIDPSMPKPLVMHAEVTGTSNIAVHDTGVATEAADRAAGAEGINGDGGETWLHCRLLGLSSKVQDCMEKLVFRQHRKSVAQQRRLTSAIP